MAAISRRTFLQLGLAAPVALSGGAASAAERPNVHDQILKTAARQESLRRASFAAVVSAGDLAALQHQLRLHFLELLDGLPQKTGVPPVHKTDQIEGDDYVIEKLAYESFPDYFVTALLYKPKQIKGRLPGILSPCGHSAVGKADAEYQKLHINLAKRGHIVLTYDPVGQGERSQFWDGSASRSRFNLACGEHAVLGNPLYLLGTSLARYRIWDGMRGIDYLASLPEVDAARIGCIGNSGGGTLTAYIAALDPRVRVAVISCYITTLSRRMGNRIQEDPASDPEQDIFGFVSAGIDHAGLLALRAPRPTLIDAARFDFFPIEGARESFAEAKRLYEVAGAREAIRLVEAAEKHGLTLPLRQAAYAWFDRWFHGSALGQDSDPAGREIPVMPRRPEQLLVCSRGQVQQTFPSRFLLPLAREEFAKRPKSRGSTLKSLLDLDPDQADFYLTEEFAGTGTNALHLLCINGVGTADWRQKKEFLQALRRQGFAVSVLDPRGVGRLRPALEVKGHDYGDALEGVEENIAYNAFLVGKSLLGMRVTDVLAAIAELKRKGKGANIVLCGRRDAALVACLAAALEPEIKKVAVEAMLLSYWPLFEARGLPINAAQILPRMLRDFGDVPDLFHAIAPRPVLVAAPRGGADPKLSSVRVVAKGFVPEPELLVEWLRQSRQ
jgi:cephalosporin-C deacetylase-like acetyl esterase